MSRGQTALMAACGAAVVYFGFFMDFKHASWVDGKAMLLLGAAAGSSAWVVCPVHGRRPRDSRLHLGMAFVLGITWMQILADEIVAVLEVRSALQESIVSSVWEAGCRASGSAGVGVRVGV